MHQLLNGLGDAAGWLMDVTGTVAMIVFFVALALLVASVPIYTLYSVITGGVSRRGSRPARP
ncbi:hypothetical protein [Streptacidiphilus sp. EB129]|uniref:hypothetical protein n=1 Tax=Streptacidiphilus sp. EB129 TaxID=3156262 RepID=UPI00351367F2